jgi:hypothetical protein
MSVTSMWDNPERTVIRLACEGDWGWDEAVANDTVLNTMLEEVNHPVAIIIDVRNGDKIPMGGLLPNMPAMRDGVMASHPSVTMTVIVGGGAIADNMLKLWNRLAPNSEARFRAASSLEEAHAIIGQYLPQATHL